MNPIITVKNLQKTFKITKGGSKGLSGLRRYFFPSYSSFQAVKDVSFEVNMGERIAFIGPNGAGKSTTIKMLTGIFLPTSGTIKILNMDPYKDRSHLAYKIGTVFGQRSQLWYHLPAIASFNLLAAIYDIDKKEYKKRLDMFLSLFQLESLIERPVKELSLGERMRCELIASFLHKPEILFLDEPTIGLDLISKSAIREFIYTCSEQEKTTIFLTSHDIADIEHVCDRIILINHGQIAVDTHLTEFRKRYCRHKQISFSSNIELKSPYKEGIYLKSKRANQYTFEIDLKITDAQKAISDLTNMLHITDLRVDEPDLEDLIKNVYRQSAP